MNRDETVAMKDKAAIKVPVFVAATAPFMNIVFDENDKLNATLEQVNSNTYDRLRICRTTMPLDGGIEAMENMAVIFSYTGAFLYPRMNGIGKQEVIDSANYLLLQLMFGGIRLDAVSPDDVGFGTLYNTGYFLTAGGASGSNFRFLMALQHQAAKNFDTIQLIDPPYHTKAQVYEAIRAGKPVACAVPEINPTMFLNGITHYRQYQLASALVFLWSTAESLIGKLWSEKTVPRGSGITGRKKFVESNSWQAAYKVEVLFQIGMISSALYSTLNEARDARNKLAHRGITPSLKACEKALEGTFALISIITNGAPNEEKFKDMTDSLSAVHKPRTGKIEPRFWREILPVPGDSKWGDAPFPSHKEIELLSLEEIRQRKR